MMMNTYLKFQSIIFLLVAAVSIHAQNGTFNGFTQDETVLYTMNKQVGQFVKRFNMEEDQYGKTLPKTDKRYHNSELREKLLPGMFDKYNPRTSGTLKKYFIQDVTNKEDPVFINFLDKNWFAEVSATFTSHGEDVNIILYLTLEKENLGSKWIISNVWYSYFPRLFPTPDSADHAKYFLHPLSHEVDFMNLHKALERPDRIQYYASDNYRPDFLTLFFYQTKIGELKFKQINDVKFHFFQIPHWYFELSYFNRNDTNSGWLISNLKYVSDKEKKKLIKTYEICNSEE